MSAHCPHLRVRVHEGFDHLKPALSERGRFAECDFQRLQHQLHAQLIGEKPFTSQGVVWVVEQALADPLRITQANIDTAHQTLDVVRRHPPVLNQLAFGVGNGHAAAPNGGQVLHGQFGEGQGEPVERADSALAARAHRVDKRQLDVIRVVTRRLRLIEQHLLAQRLGGIGVEVRDVIVEALALRQCVNAGQRHQLRAVFKAVGGAGVAQPRWKRRIDRRQIKRLRGFTHLEHGRGVRHCLDALLQSRERHGLIQCPDSVQLPLQHTHRLGVEKVAGGLVKHTLRTLQSITRGKPQAPEAGQRPQGRKTLKGPARRAIEPGAYTVLDHLDHGIRGDHIKPAPGRPQPARHAMHRDRCLRVKQPCLERALAQALIAVGIAHNLTQRLALVVRELRRPRDAGQHLVLNHLAHPVQPGTTGINGLIPIRDERVLKGNRPNTQQLQQHGFDHAHGFDRHKATDRRRHRAHRYETRQVVVIPVGERCSAGDMLQHFIDQ